MYRVFHFHKFFNAGRITHEYHKIIALYFADSCRSKSALIENIKKDKANKSKM